MENNLVKHLRPARYKRPTDLEFWLTIGFFLSSQLRHGKASVTLSTRVEVLENRLQKLIISSDRRKTLAGSCTLDEAAFRPLFCKISTHFAENIQAGSLFLANAMVLESHSKQAQAEGQLRRIPGKPLLKGYFFVGGLQCFLHTKYSYYIDIEWKWGINSPDIGAALLLTVGRAEEVLGRPLVVLADSTFPTSRLLIDTYHLKSSFIASASTSKHSGELRMLPTVLGEESEKRGPYLLHHPKHRLIAFCWKKPKGMQCLITNAVYYDNQPSVKPIMSYAQALVLAENFSVEWLQNNTKFPPPSNDLVASDPFAYVSECTRVDLAKPADGIVTYESLKKLRLNTLNYMLKSLNIHKGTQMKKDDIIQMILQAHPLAEKAGAVEYMEGVESGSEEEDAIDENVDNESAMDDTAGENGGEEEEEESAPVKGQNLKRKRSATIDNNADVFLWRSNKPQYAELYTEYSGLQHQMNAIFSSVFAAPVLSAPGSKAFWVAVYLPLFNTFTFWMELEASARGDIERADIDSVPILAGPFYLDLLTELVEYCEEIHSQDGQSSSKS